MKQALILFCITCITSVTFAQVDANKIKVVSDNDSIRFIVDGSVTSIANRDMANYYFAQGIEAAQSADYKSAESKFRVALLYDLQNPEILYNLGLSQYFQENYADALATFDNAAAFDPRNKDIYNQRGLCKAMLGDFEKAETDFVIMLQYDPAFPMGNFNYGILLLQKGDYPSACHYLQKADELGYESAPAVLATYCNN